MKLLNADCAEALKTLEANSIDSLVTDPPAGINFMGKEWDQDHGGREGWVKAFAALFAECYRVMKPGAWGLVWALPRTSHWTASALEDAGFEVRDIVMHIFGTGFPKSHDIAKAIDKANGVEFKAVPAEGVGFMGADGPGGYNPTVNKLVQVGERTEEAKKWEGWGTALKPAAEHWVLVRKPLDGTVVENVRKHGVGGINIDACRVPSDKPIPINKLEEWSGFGQVKKPGYVATENNKGRFPANVVLDEGAAVVLDAQSGDRSSPWIGNKKGKTVGKKGGKMFGGAEQATDAKTEHGDAGGASRFFYVAKVAPKERDLGGVDNNHPTVKSKALMNYLIKLITPPGGTVLDPFMGSGSTGIACIEGGWEFVGIEREKQYFDIARLRIEAAKVIKEKA